MAGETTKCPMCGTKLKMMDGRMTCKKCGYYIRNREADGSLSPERTIAGGQYAASGQAGANRQTAPLGKSGSGTSPWQGSSSPRRNTEHNPAVGIVISLVSGIACAALLAAIILVKSGTFSQMLPDRSSQEDSPSRHAEASSQPAGASSEDRAQATASIPQSAFFQQVAEYIWGKPCNNITAQEYASLTAIQIDRDEKSISYQLDYGEPQTVTYQSGIDMKLSDLSCFPGLEAIAVDDDLQKGDLKGLDSLYGVYSENTIEELTKIIPHPESITNLGITDDFLKESLTGLDSFPNLEYLAVDYSGLEDISALEQFPGLLGLTLEGCDRLTDFSPLMNLTELEQLSIESDQLKSIEFIRNMPMLNSLSIESSQVSGVDALADCPNLQYLYLYLDEAYDVGDYSVIGNLTLLNELVLEMDWGHNGTLPSFAGLTDLQYLSVKNASDLTPLQDAQGVTYLSLENCSGNTLEAIASLQSLSVLYINDFSSYVASLEPLTRLQNLTMLSLEDTSVFGNIEEIFGIPTLTHLYLDGCQVGMDFDRLPVNETLTALSLDRISVLHDPTFNNGDKVSLSDHYDMFDCFPNLTELYLVSLKIDSIDFVEKLPRLQYLDITDNNVTSLKPLESLSDFQAVWCGRNTILESLPEDSGITVYTED